jgi:hypothetical protein
MRTCLSLLEPPQSKHLLHLVFLQVSVAVLLDSFVTASLRMLEEERRRHLAESKSRKTVSSTLDPLLERLARDFVDNADLSFRLQNLFKVLYVDCHYSISDSTNQSFSRQPSYSAFLLFKVCLLSCAPPWPPLLGPLFYSLLPTSQALPFALVFSIPNAVRSVKFVQ